MINLQSDSSGYRSKPALPWLGVLVSLLALSVGCTTTPQDRAATSSATTSVTTGEVTGTADAEVTETSTDAPTGTDEDPAITHATDASKDHPSLDSRLVGLLNAENRTDYAASRDLDLRNGSVLVVVELRPNRSLPPDFDADVRARHENLVQAWVPLDELGVLADHANVRFVRPPHEPATDSPSMEDSPNDASNT